MKLEAAENSKNYKIDHKILRLALRHHSVAKGFTGVQVPIRFSFDHFFTRLGRFQHYIESDLIKKSDLDPYLIFWMNAINGKGQIGRF